MRYPISGNNTVTLNGTASLAGQALLGRNLTTGRVFWLREAWIYNASTGNILALFDASVGTTYAATAALFRVVADGPNEMTKVAFAAPGLKFATNCAIAREATTVSGAFAAGSCGGSGYEEA